MFFSCFYFKSQLSWQKDFWSYFQWKRKDDLHSWNCLSHLNSLLQCGICSLHCMHPTLAQWNRFNLWPLDFTYCTAHLSEHTRKHAVEDIYLTWEKVLKLYNQESVKQQIKGEEKSTFIFYGPPLEKLHRRKYVVKYLMFTRNIKENVYFNALQTWGIMNVYLHKMGKLSVKLANKHVYIPCII